MATENIVSKVYRVLTDVSSRVWDKISFWCLAKDVELANGKNLETTCGSITGITSSLTSTSKTMAASASAIKELNDKITDLNSNLYSDAEFLAFNTASPYKGRLLLIIVTNSAGTIKYTVAGTTYTKTLGANVTYSEWHNVEVGETITLVSATTDLIKTINAILLHNSN